MSSDITISGVIDKVGSYLFEKKIETGKTGCGESRRSVEEQLKGEGVPMDQPEGEEVLPVDNEGNPILSNDIWYEVEGQGMRFQETPWLTFEADLHGQNVQNLDLYIEIGTDSTKITAEILNLAGEVTGEFVMPENGCHPGLINVTTLSQEAIDLIAQDPQQAEELGIQGCPDSGYEALVACPSNSLPIYASEYTIDDNPEGAPEDYPKLVGVVCEGSPGAIKIPVPRKYYSDGVLRITFKLKMAVDAEQADENATYKTPLRVRVKAQSKSSGGIK